MSAERAAICCEQRTSDYVFRIETNGGVSFLTADEQIGWRGLNFLAVVEGQEMAAKMSRLEKDASGTQFVLALAYPVPGLVERVTVRLLSDPPAMTIARVFANQGTRGAEIREVQTAAAAVLFPGPAQSLRCVHVSNLRETARRVSRRIGPFVSPLPDRSRLLGDSEGHPFPALAICDAEMRTYLLEASLQQDVFTQMWRIKADPGLGGNCSIFSDYAAIARDGRSQPITLRPGEERRLDSLFYQIKVGCDLENLYDDYLAELNRRYDLRGGKSPLLHSAVYCTWNYSFFADISEEVIARQAEFIARSLKGIRYFLIDDGYQLSENTPSYDFGKWYPDPEANVDPVRFPGGMKATAGMIRSAGLKPALWWSPALGRRNRLVQDHPDWLCLDDEGRSWSMDSGPERKAALDFSVKEVREFVEFALETIFLKWGYVGIKLDFCTYPFDCKDLRFHGGEGVRWWYWFLETIARFIPEDGFLQLCGGAPYGNPFLGRYCDNHRVGGDIGKGLWSQHRAVSGAPLPLLAVPGRSTMLMDVDSAGIRPDLTAEENLSRLNWCFITQGVMGIGGDLTRLADEQLGWLNHITEACDRGHKVHCPDRRAFVGEPLPEVLYVDYPPGSRTARAGVRKHVGFFNWDDEPRTITYALSALGLSQSDRIRDFWTRQSVAPAAGRLSVELKGRASRLLEAGPD